MPNAFCCPLVHYPEDFGLYPAMTAGGREGRAKVSGAPHCCHSAGEGLPGGEPMSGGRDYMMALRVNMKSKWGMLVWSLSSASRRKIQFVVQGDM